MRRRAVTRKEDGRSGSSGRGLSRGAAMMMTVSEGVDKQALR